MRTFILTASLALISGLTFLAFKYPHAYRQVSSPLRELISLAWIAAAAWTFGVSGGIRSMTPYLKEEHLEKTSRLMSENVEFMRDFMPGGVVVVAFFLLISPLRRLLKKDKKEETPE
jgi:hypothetical protein